MFTRINNMGLKVLIVEDQFIEANDLQLILKSAGHSVCGIAKSVAAALEFLQTNKPDIVLLDIFLKGPKTGIDLAPSLTSENIPFIFISANSDPSTFDAAKATRPDGFLIKPFRKLDILVALDIAIYRHQYANEHALHQDQWRKNSNTLPGQTEALAEFKQIIGRSPRLLQVLDLVSQVAPLDTSVLILGETGVGKEGIAKAIHQLSKRKNKPLIKVNCGAIPPSLIESELFGHEKGAFSGASDRRIGKFEQAQGGTIFLDEIGEMPLETQTKLLRVIQEKELERIGGRTTIKLDIRFITATNRNLYKEVAAGKFRIDLYYRINVFTITLAPLRERKEDIPSLVDYFLKKHAKLSYNQPKRVSPQALEKLLAYSWPGNIRELENVIERHIIITPFGTISSIDLPEDETAENQKMGDVSKTKSPAGHEKQSILAALNKSNGKVSGKGGAAEILNLPAATLASKMKKLGISWSFVSG
ncbi:sigma-54-dependent transcriptional regulator [Dyadobacter fanqingshengii]|uniref:Sigma-54 dependent transcriptional regulator n=1 Tax=Dyadobacter fanqingshengii TaxID=2906443 RepID=A0A9X1PAH2_9BACT|nr:sigma-54 dependent transcriptional regulator [Dyadobacter fanqingshengii]MCF0039717.1 sigma-54 dependent transcriptional regulator [Dyadobacter fanqingshengii]USJ38520.1 sigma-54 dependent transcriptional regulator [Dyadobacter fanqingshengii]